MENSNSAATGITTTTIGAIIPPSKWPEAEIETPPGIQPVSFTNGVLKRHKYHRNTVVGGVAAYKECLKNHAASLGGHALDGCGDFMPAPTATAADPTSLRCAACGCHRNFHRREPDELGGVGGVPTTRHVIEYHPHHRHHPLPPPGAHLPQVVAACRVESPGSAPHMLLALSNGGDDIPNKKPSTTTNIELQHHRIFGTSPQMASRKRHRTKFSQEQKGKMYEFAEKVGWRMLKSNEDLVNGFCKEIGVERGVFKVWMHNNKNTLGNRSAVATNHGISGNNQGGISVEDINHPIEEEDDDQNVINGNSHSSSISNNSNNQHHQQYNHGSNNVVPANNASSCSS